MLLYIQKRTSYTSLIKLVSEKTKKKITEERLNSEASTSAIVDFYKKGTIQKKKGNVCVTADPRINIKKKTLTLADLEKVKESQISEHAIFDRRRFNEKLKLSSFLNVCVDVGQINRAYNLLLKYGRSRQADIQHYNIVLRGWAKLGAISQINETRMNMNNNGILPNTETFAYTLLCYAKTKDNNKNNLKFLLSEMKEYGIDNRLIFQSTYMNENERTIVSNLLKTFDPKYEDVFCSEPVHYDCKLLDELNSSLPKRYDLGGLTDLSKLVSWAEHQRTIEWKSSVSVKSVAFMQENSEKASQYSNVWHKHHEMWRKALSKALDESLMTLQEQSTTTDKIHLYPYLCSVDKNMIVQLLLDEIETNAGFASYSMSTNYLHLQLGNKMMIRYMRAKAIADGSHQEKLKIYNQYLTEYCRNPDLMGRLNSREFFQTKAMATKNYSIYKDKLTYIEQWPHHVVSSVGRFLYGLILREVKFDPKVVKNPSKEIKVSNLVNAFYTAYFQVDNTHKIKEEFRTHGEFEIFHQRSCGVRLKFDYSFLPTSSPPLPWLSHRFGGYIANKSDLVRVPHPFAEQMFATVWNTNDQKLYPSLDSLNALGLCPWIVNKDILDIVIDLFKSGGDANLSVPLNESRMDSAEPTLKEDASKADRILFIREKKKFDQKKREMYSLWRDCLYRLSIANHFRDKVFWFPHNMDFRGRTYPIPPHFNHLGSDLARSLLLFAKGQPLGEHGLDWLKIHLINLVGNMKKASLNERLEYANSILHLEVLDSADNPFDGRKWWTKNDNPWQVLSCCKEIAKAIRSRDHKQYVSHFPVHQDGSCNGLQHYAALGRDPGGAAAVNLVPSDKPQDVYMRVVDIVEEMRKQDAEKGTELAVALEGFIQRKVIKQTVMTTVYGVTRYGARQQIARQLVAKGFPDKDVWRAAMYLTSKTFESIGKMFEKSRLIQDWLNACAFVIATRYRQPVSWETPLGFRVIQPYTNGERSRAVGDPSSSRGFSSNLNSSKQRTAFPPNYIHSLDSSHMMLTSLFCQHQGITFVSVHDCYWTHPDNVDAMNRICREQFIALHMEPLLRQLSDQFIARYQRYEDEISNTSKKNHDRHNGKKQLSNPMVPKNNLTDSSAMSSQEQTTMPLIEMFETTRSIAQARTFAIFKQLPGAGDFNLDDVLKSTYFFS